MKTFVIDRFEGDLAVLEEESGAMRDIPRARLPQDVRQGDVLIEQNGSLHVDTAETQRRAAQAKADLQALFHQKGRKD